MTGNDYKYDVAFSFLKEDEELATNMNDLIQDRLSTFIYSGRQEEIAGTKIEERVLTSRGAQVQLLSRPPGLFAGLPDFGKPFFSWTLEGFEGFDHVKTYPLFICRGVLKRGDKK